MLIARIVVDVDCDGAQGGDFGGQGVERVVVLSGRDQYNGGFVQDEDVAYRSRS